MHNSVIPLAKAPSVVAIKQIRTDDFATSDELENARQEIDMLRNLHHPNIVKYIGYEQTEHELDIILEYCEGGSLQSILRKFRKFPENLVGVYVAQILQGLSYLHLNAVVHRDIKPGNLLSTKEGIVKLADFGVARFQDGQGTVVGSPYWIAPEVIRLNGATSASDIWSLGCTIIQLVSGKAPYQDLPAMAAMFRIGQDEHPPFPPNISKLLKDFLSKCLVRIPSARWSAEELLQHEWIRQCLLERQREAPLQNNFERDIQMVEQWNKVLQNSSPRDIRHLNRPGGLKKGSSGSRARDEFSAAMGGSGSTSMGISDSNEGAAKRTVSSIAGYEDDSSDDWENAFENLDNLQLKPRPQPVSLYPQAIVAPGSPSLGSRKHSRSIASDTQDADPAAALPPPIEHSASYQLSNENISQSQPGASANLHPKAHTSPPSPTMRALRKHHSQQPQQQQQQQQQQPPQTTLGLGYTQEDESDASGLSQEIAYLDNIDYAGGAPLSATSTTSLHSSSAFPSGLVDGIPASDAHTGVHEGRQTKRPSLGLRQEPSLSSSAPSVSSQASFKRERGLSSLSLDAPDLANEHADRQSSSNSQQAKQARHNHGSQHRHHQHYHHHHHSSQDSREIQEMYANKSSKELLQRETEITWVQEVAKSIAELRTAAQDKSVIYQCRQIGFILREGRGVFSTSSEWRVRAIVDTIFGYRSSPAVVFSLLRVVNLLCRMNPLYVRIHCLHGILPLIFNILQNTQPQSPMEIELQAEAIKFIMLICGSNDVAAMQMFLACNGVSTLCASIAAIAEQDIDFAAVPMASVINALTALIGSKAIPPEFATEDFNTLLGQARVIGSLATLFEKYGAACQPLSIGHSSRSSGKSDLGIGSQPSPAEHRYIKVCNVLHSASRLFNDIVRRVPPLQDQICESNILVVIFAHLYRYPQNATRLVMHAVRQLSKNPMSLDALDAAGMFGVSTALIKSTSGEAYREYIMATILRLCISPERQIKLATKYPALVWAAMDCTELKGVKSLSTFGRSIILGLANGDSQCCRALKDVGAFELIVKLISSERWCGQAVSAILAWTKTVPSDIVPSLTDEQSTKGWRDLAQPLWTLSASSTTLDLYASTFYSLVRLHVPQFPKACMGSGEANGENIWVVLMERYLQCSGVGSSREQLAVRMSNALDNVRLGKTGMLQQPEVVSGNHMNATTRLTFLNLLLILQPYLQATTPEMHSRISVYCTEMLASSKIDPALPVRRASLTLSHALERM
ncbi:Protein kinase of the Mitotic Exit Network [Dipsacomyces acuminosporus]|nr:Protein kinase of the Mitotic Exit Network [Dipsacomyces acuminosporus]